MWSSRERDLLLYLVVVEVVSRQDYVACLEPRGFIFGDCVVDETRIDGLGNWREFEPRRFDPSY